MTSHPATRWVAWSAALLLITIDARAEEPPAGSTAGEGPLGAAPAPGAAAAPSPAATATPSPAATAAPSPTWAAPPRPPVAPSARPPAARPAAAPPYSLPWGLRPAMPVSVLRADTAVAVFDEPAGRGESLATMFLVSYKVTPRFAPFARLGTVAHWPPGRASEVVVTNPAFGGSYGVTFFNQLRLAMMLGVALPLGQGGGDTPNAAQAEAIKAGVLARSALDNAMFAVNDLVIFPGIDLAWVAHRVTVQAELTVLQLIRVKGQAVQPDALRTNVTMGLHVGYFVLPQLSLGAELRYQVWASTPTAVGADATGTLRDTLSVAAGVRGHFRLSSRVWLRPGLAYSRGLDSPMSDRNYHTAIIDLPLVF